MVTRLSRILFVSFTSKLYGPSHSLLKLVKYLRHKYEIAVVAPTGGDLLHELDALGVVGYEAGPYDLRARSIPGLVRLIRQGDFNLVYGNNFSSGCRNALIAAKLTHRPFVWHIREMIWEASRRTAYFLRYTDAIIAVSQACARSVERHRPRRPIHVVYNGIDIEDFQSKLATRGYAHRELGLPRSYRIVCSVADVCARKGQIYALKVAAEVTQTCPQVAFCFLGDLDLEPAYTSRLQQMVSELGLTNWVHFLGHRRDVSEFLQGSDIFLHTAVKDPNPRAVLEAMAAQLPVVTFDVDGVSEMVVHGKTGCLVPVGDVPAMVEALRELLDNPSLRARMGERGRERVEAMFTAEETARQVGAVIDRLL